MNTAGLSRCVRKVPTAYYSPNGQRLLRPQKGINIVLYEDGTTRKIVVK